MSFNIYKLVQRWILQTLQIQYACLSAACYKFICYPLHFTKQRLKEGNLNILYT